MTLILPETNYDEEDFKEVDPLDAIALVHFREAIRYMAMAGWDWPKTLTFVILAAARCFVGFRKIYPRKGDDECSPLAGASEWLVEL